MQDDRHNTHAVIGVDIGGTNMQMGVLDQHNVMLGRARRKTEAHRGVDGVLANMVSGINEACQAAGCLLEHVSAVGVAAAGAIDIPRGVILDAPNLGFDNVPFRQLATQATGRPVVLDNDVNGAVWGEYHLGAGDAKGDALGVWVGTGVGGGLVLNGQLYHGELFTAGELGQTVISPRAPDGERTVEDLCSRSGLRERLLATFPEHPGSAMYELTGGDPQRIDMETIRAAFAANDSLTMQLVNDAAELLGIAIANCVTLLALDTVIIGGGVTEALGSPFLERIRVSFERDVFPEENRCCKLVPTKLAADAGLLGAALLARGCA